MEKHIIENIVAIETHIENLARENKLLKEYLKKSIHKLNTTIIPSEHIYEKYIEKVLENM